MEKGKRKPLTAKRIIIIVAIIIVAAALILQTATIVLCRMNFWQRFDSSGDLLRPDVSDYDGLQREKATFKSNKGQELVGYYYSNENIDSYKGLIVLNHGYGGGGHTFYIGTISAFANDGYLVYAFDKTANDESEGEGIWGLPQGAVDLEYALDFLRCEKRAEGLPLLLYGHSWGGYSSCAVLETNDDITAAVSMSGFNESKDMLIDQGVDMYGGYVKLLSPFMTMYDVIGYGFKNASYSSLKGLEKTDAQVLVLHSEDDPVINIEDAALLYQEKLSDRDNIEFYITNGRGHDVFISPEAREYRKEVQEGSRQIRETTAEENLMAAMQEYAKSVDRVRYNAPDKEIIQMVLDFYDNAINAEK